MKENFWEGGLAAGAAVLLAASMVFAQAADPADLVLLHGKIVTMDKNHPAAEALAVRGDRIIAAGTDAQVQRHIGKATRVIDRRDLGQ